MSKTSKDLILDVFRISNAVCRGQPWAELSSVGSQSLDRLPYRERFFIVPCQSTLGLTEVSKSDSSWFRLPDR